MPIQKPWLNAAARTALHTWLAAHKSGSREEYKKGKICTLGSNEMGKRGVHSTRSHYHDKVITMTRSLPTNQDTFGVDSKL